MINRCTGKLLRKNHVSEDLEEFIEKYRDYTPRSWMLESGMCGRSSSQRLNEAIKKWSLHNREPWTADLLDMHFRPTPRYMDQNFGPEMVDEYSRFSETYNVPIECAYKS